MRLPSDIFDELTEATVEGWVRWEKFSFMARFFDFGGGYDSLMAVFRFADTNHLRFGLFDENGSFHEITVEGILSEGTWYHIAAVSGTGGMKLYVNGVLVGENSYDGSFSRISGANNLLGKDNVDESRPTLNGQLDEVRVLSVARTEKQIRDTMFTVVRDDGYPLAIFRYTQSSTCVSWKTAHPHAQPSTRNTWNRNGRRMENLPICGWIG